MLSLLVGGIALSGGVNVHVNDLVVHSSRGVCGIIAECRLETKTIQEVTLKGGGVGKDSLLSTLRSQSSVYFIGSIDPALDIIHRLGFLVIDFVHDVWV